MKSSSQTFGSEDPWKGGHYEIEFELGAPSDDRLGLAVESIWSHPSLDGCYLSREREAQTQGRISPREHVGEGHLYGIACLPNGSTAACATYVCRLQDENARPYRDLLAFYVPLGSLGSTYAIGGYPFSDVDRAVKWRVELDEWLVGLGRFVYERVTFSLALVGFEVDFPRVSADTVRQNGIPEERFDGYLWPLGNELKWYAPNSWEIIRFSDDRTSVK